MNRLLHSPRNDKSFNPFNVAAIAASHSAPLQPTTPQAAIWYAQHGYSVLPLQPDTKLPLTSRGVKDATTNIAQIRHWWRRWPHANIGIAAGSSRLVILDFDTYKTGVKVGDVLAQADLETVIVNTPREGTHVWYRQPLGKMLGNVTGNLPGGIDVRGVGGYVVAPPSIVDGKRYEFAAGHRVNEVDVAELPAHILATLTSSQTAPDGPTVTFTGKPTAKPDLSRWALSDGICTLIQHGVPKGGRSEADFRVILALVAAGADDNQIRDVFTHFAIGDKYREKRNHGDKYLAHSISKVRASIGDNHPRADVRQLQQLTIARSWVRGPACVAKLREAGNQRAADLIPFLDAIVELAQERRARRVALTVRDLANRCAIASATAQRRLKRLAAAGFLAVDADNQGTLIDLAPLLDQVDLSETRQCEKSGNSPDNVESVSLRSTSNTDFFADHRTDDAFTAYPYTYAIKRRQAPTVLLPSLGAAGLLLWDALCTGGTVNELAATTGLTVAAVRVTLKRFKAAGLLVIWQAGRALVYELHPDAEERLEERRQHMATAGVGQLRVARNYAATAAYAQRRLENDPTLEVGHRARLEHRCHKYRDLAAATFEALAHSGFNPYALHVATQGDNGNHNGNYAALVACS